MKETDEVVERNRELLLQRSKVGLQKYGCGLDNSGLSLKQFLVHALEETLDKANYLQGAIMSMEQEENNNLTNQ